MSKRVSIILALTALSGCINANNVNPNISPNFSNNLNSGLASKENTANNQVKQPAALPHLQPVNGSPEPAEKSNFSSGLDVPGSPLPQTEIPSPNQSTEGPPQPPNLPSIPITEGTPTPLPQQGTGALEAGLSWEPVNSAFATQATRQDIKELRLTIDSPEIRALTGKTLTKTFSLQKQRTKISNIPVGQIKVVLDAFDNSGERIGTTGVDNINIKNGETAVVNLRLQLMDSVISETTENSGGSLSLEVAILDGQTIVRRKEVMPRGGYLLFDDQTTCPPPVSQITSPTFNPPEMPVSLPNLGIPFPALDLSKLEANLQGSSSGDSMFEGMVLSDIAGSSVGPGSCTDLVGSSVSTKPPRFLFRQALLKLQPGQKLNISSLLDKSGINGEVIWSSNHPERIQINAQGEAVTITTGEALLKATLGAYQATLPVLISSQAVSNRPFMPPVSRLQVNKTSFRTGEQLSLEALNTSGSIAAFYWKISNGMLDSRSYEPYTSLKFSKPGLYQVSLWLMGTNGEWFPATNSPQIVGVMP